MSWGLNKYKKQSTLGSVALFFALSVLSTAHAAIISAEQLMMKVYNEQDYQLGYSAFIGSGDLQDAWRVAKSAVQQQPNNLQWRQRLAQTSEWIQKPHDAYSQWQFIYQRNRQDKLANEALLRLAPALGDKQMALNLWLSRHANTALTRVQLDEVTTLFEENSQTEAGITFFERNYAQNHNPEYLAAAARLQQRMGQDDKALALLEKVLSGHPAQSEWVISAVILNLRKYDSHKAMTLMQTYQSQMPDEQVEFWQLMGDMAWLQQQDDTSIRAYKQLAKQKVLTDIQRDRLLTLLEVYDPQEATNLAYMLYQQQKDDKNLIKAMGYSVQQQDWMRFAQLLRDISVADLQKLEKNAEFLLMRGQYFSRIKQSEKAQKDIETAYKIAGADANIIAQVLFYYIDQRDIPSVKDLLRVHGQRALTEPVLWQSFAAAYHELDDIPQAIAFYQKQLKATPNDPLWMLNYADAVSRSGQIGMADRIRRQAWALLAQQKDTAKTPPLPLSKYPQLLAYANLTLQNLAGDGANKYMQRMVNRLRGLDDKQQDDQQTNDLILSWAINNNAIPAAKLWLMGRYGKHYQSQAPLWGESTVALQQNDTQTLARLNKNSDGLPPYDRHDIAQALEFEGQAAQIAFDNMRGNKPDNAMHERYVSSYLKQANLVGMQMDMTQGDGVNTTGGMVFTSLRLAPHWHLGVEVSQYALSQDRDSLYTDAVRRNNLAGLSITNQRERYQWSAATRQHQMQTNWWSGELQGSYDLSSNLELAASVRYQMPNRDTTAMSMAGMEDVLQVSATYAFTVRDYLRVSTELAQYHTQTGQDLGTGTHFDWEVGHRIRTEYPDWNVRLLGAHRRYAINNATVIDATSMAIFKDPAQAAIADSFLPTDTDYFALCAGAGQNLSERRNLDGTKQIGRYYSKAWRPLGEVCATYNSASQSNGYSGLAGMRGSIDGEDQLLIVYQESNGGLQLPNQTLRELSAKYERLF
jgi:predicted Zn-dependent protease